MPLRDKASVVREPKHATVSEGQACCSRDDIRHQTLLSLQPRREPTPWRRA
jgi:hypothetical protein